MHRFRFLRTEPEKTVPTYTGYDVYLGVEVYRPGIGRLLRGLAERKLENVRILLRLAAEFEARGETQLAKKRLYSQVASPVGRLPSSCTKPITF